MKCNYCGNELPENADFCPECGGIISLDASSQEKAETLIPESEPNVFKTEEFEKENQSQPAMEIQADPEEETAPVVEALPEYYSDEEQNNEETDEEVVDGFAQQEPDLQNDNQFAPPEYTSDLSYLDLKKEEESLNDTPEGQAKLLFGEEVVEKKSQDDTEKTIISDTDEHGSENEAEDVPMVDNSLIEALFDDDSFDKSNDEDIEDITPAYNAKIKRVNQKKKSSNGGYVTVFALVIVLVGIIFAAGYVVDNVLPKLSSGNVTTTEPIDSQVNASTLPTTTSPALTTETSSSTTETTESTTVDSYESSTSQQASTSNTTTSTTVTSTSSSTTTSTTSQSTVSVKEPSSYNMSVAAYFPSNGSVLLKASASSSADTVATQPYGYPLYAYASENGYYYVESPYHDLMGWVKTSDVYKYQESTTTATTTTKPTTTNPTTTTTNPTTTTTKPTTTGTTASGDGYTAYKTPYTATIYPPDNDALNFRSGPGTGYGIVATVPYGFTVSVIGYSTTDSDWVYVKVNDSSYPYSFPEGWVYKDYIS